jgi:hypothetical protein
MNRFGAIRARRWLLVASLALAQSPGTDLIGRPVDLDLAKGVQPPPRNTATLPTTFAGAAKTQPVDPKWGTVALPAEEPPRPDGDLDQSRRHRLDARRAAGCQAAPAADA